MQLTKSLVVMTAVAAVVGGSLVSAGDAAASPSIAGTYNVVAPVRVLNTIDGTGAAKGVVGPGKSITFDAARTLGTKLVSAEALNVEVVGPSASGVLRVYPGGAAEPATSSLNYYPGTTTANEVLVGYGSSGTVTIHNVSTGSVNIVADISGYWTGGSVADDIAGAFTPLTGTRVLDTRTSNTPIAATASQSVPVLGLGGVPATGVSAVAVNVTVPTPTVSGYVTATAGPTDQQDGARTSDVNFYARESRANLVVVPVDPDTGAISLYNSAAVPVGAIVDVVGYFSDGSPTDDGAFQYFDPYRNSDTRTTGSAVGAGKTATIQPGVGGSPSLFKAVVANLTITGATARGFVTTWDGSGTRPLTSNGNFAAARNTAITIITPINSDGTISVYNGSSAPISLILDVHGFIINDVSGSPAVAHAKIKSALAKAHRAAVQRLAP